MYTSGTAQLQDSSSFAAPFHIDSGLLLFLTPFKKHPLLIRNRLQQNLNTNILEEGSVIVIVASALPNWLLKGKESSSKFFAAPHAVPSLSSNLLSRTVFARMKIVPDTAMPLSSSGHHGLKFGDFFSGKVSSRPLEEEASLCPLSGPAPGLPSASPLQQQWNGLKKTECDTDKAYCWMNCLEVPSSCPDSMPVECINRDSAPCCTDTITEGCENMDQSCRWQCKASNHSQDMFCDGQGTDMYMQGFTVSN